MPLGVTRRGVFRSLTPVVKEGLGSVGHLCRRDIMCWLQLQIAKVDSSWYCSGHIFSGSLRLNINMADIDEVII